MEIKVYLDVENSSWSRKAKEWLKKKKLAFQEHIVSESETCRDELLQKSSQLGVPLFDIDGKIIVGFQEKELEEVIKKTKS